MFLTSCPAGTPSVPGTCTKQTAAPCRSPPPPFEHFALPVDLGPHNKVRVLCGTGEPTIVPNVSCDWQSFQLEKNEVVHHVVFSVKHTDYTSKERVNACTIEVEAVHACAPWDTTNGHSRQPLENFRPTRANKTTLAEESDGCWVQNSH